MTRASRLSDVAPKREAITRASRPGKLPAETRAEAGADELRSAQASLRLGPRVAASSEPPAKGPALQPPPATTRG